MVPFLLACSSPPTPVPAPPPVTQPAPAPAAAPAPEAPPERPPAMYGMKAVDYACAPCGEMRSQMAVDLVATASSSLPKHPPANVLSPDMALAWCEGADGDGLGTTLEIDLGRPLLVHGLAVWGGYFKSADLLAANARVKKVRVRTDTGVDEVVELEDPSVAKATDPSSGAAVSDWFAHMVEAEPPWRVLDSAEGKPPAQKVSIELLEVWPGKKYQDTCVSRVDIMTIDPEEL